MSITATKQNRLALSSSIFSKKSTKFHLNLVKCVEILSKISLIDESLSGMNPIFDFTLLGYVD